jgi:hypothetical protein
MSRRCGNSFAVRFPTNSSVIVAAAYSARLTPIEMMRPPLVPAMVLGGLRVNMARLMTVQARNSAQIQNHGGTLTGRRRRSSSAIGTAMIGKMKLASPRTHQSGTSMSSAHSGQAGARRKRPVSSRRSA